MKKGLWIALTVVVVLLVVVATAYFWVKNKAWNQVATTAADYGYVLDQPEIKVRWQGGLHFHIEILNLNVEFKEPAALRGTAELPRLFADLEYFRENSLVLVHDLELERLQLNASLLPSEAEPAPEEKTADNKAPEIPRLAFPEITLPQDLSLPVQVEVRNLRLTGEQIQVKMPEPTSVDFKAQDLKLQSSLLGTLDKIQAKVDLQLPKWNLDFKTQSQLAQIQNGSLSFNFETQNSKEALDKLNSQVGIKATWQSMNFASQSMDPKTGQLREMWAKDQGGSLDMKADPKTAEVLLAGKNLTSSFSKKSTGWSVRVQPLSQNEKQSRFEVVAEIPEALRLNAKIQTDNKLNLEKPSAKVDGSLGFHPDLFAVFVEDLPIQLQGRFESTFSASLSPQEDIIFRVDLKGQGVNANIRAEASLPQKKGQSTGQLVLDLEKQKAKFEDKAFSGHVKLPFKFIWSENERLFLETEAQFENFAIRSPKFNLFAMSGRLPLRQSWRQTNQRWDLSPRLQLNAFGRVDSDSYAPLEFGDYAIHIGRLQMDGKSWGPIDVQLRINQNLLRSTAWQIGLEQGRLEGAFNLDLKLENPKVGMMMRAFGVHPGEILPKGTGRGEWLNQPLSFFMGMDWDINKAEALGRIDWTNINSAQVLGLLDILDPQFENNTYNQARTILSSAYPTRVQVDLKGRVADLRIRTNLVNLPEVRDVPLSPYLLRANEMLYQNQFYQELRALNE